VIWLDYGELAIIRDAPGRDREGVDVPRLGVLKCLFGDGLE
jgi:hypothetical protein